MRLKEDVETLRPELERTVKDRIESALSNTLGFLQRAFRPDGDYKPEHVRWPRPDDPKLGPLVGRSRIGSAASSDGSSIAEKSAAAESERGRGFWIGELEADTTLESDYILFLYFLDKRAYREKIRKLANHLRKLQLEDGSWNIFYGAKGDISASVKAYFALKLADHSVDEPFMVRARDAILKMGGAEKVNSYTKIYLSFLNQFDWQEIPAIPPEIILLPRFFYFNVYEISYWSRAILIPLSILYAKKPNRNNPPDVTIDEIFTTRYRSGAGKTPSKSGESMGNVDGASLGGRLRANDGNGHPEGGHQGDLGGVDSAEHDSSKNNGSRMNGQRQRSAGLPRDPNLISWRNFFLVADRILRLIEKTPLKPFRSLALKRAEDWVVSRSEDSDGLGAIFPSMVNSVMALHCLGHDESHPTFACNIEKLQELEIEADDCIRLQPCLSPVWDTALVINAMVEAGYSPDAPEILASAQWLLDKEVRKPGDWNIRVNAEVSGWPFQFRNEFYPDIDDTAAVILALDRCDHTKVEGLEQSINRGLNWTVSMQCSNGGWAAFDVDIDHQVLTHVPYADHNAMLDPACSDITGRVLESLGRFSELRGNPQYDQAIQRGVQYLKDSQEEDGSWYGRWGVNYLYGTWQSLKGLMCVGERPDAPYVRKAVEWLKSCQNEDGGWGETCDSYKNAALKGCGKTTASQTSWAVMGLVAAGEVETDAVERGVAFLVNSQNEDGTWDEEEFTGTGFPDVFYLRYHFYRVTFPLFALGYYRNVKYGIELPKLAGKTIKLSKMRSRPAESILKGLRDGLFRNGNGRKNGNGSGTNGSDTNGNALESR